MPEKKSKWKTVRCVVEYRTLDDFSERDLARYVQGLLDEDVYGVLNHSKPWAKPFSAVLARMVAARPKRLQAAARAADALATRLRKL